MATYRKPQWISNTYRTAEELRSYIRSQAKIANTRLRALEKKGLSQASSAYRYVKEAEASHVNYMTRTEGKTVRGRQTQGGLLKWRTNLRGMNINELRQEALELDIFLYRAQTSTVSGTLAVTDKWKKSITSNKDVPSDIRDRFNAMSREEISDFWRFDFMKKLVNAYGSDTAIEFVMKNVSKNKGLSYEDLRTALEQFESMNYAITDKTPLRNLELHLEHWNKPTAEDDVR